jgi:hypothetical protein
MVPKKTAQPGPGSWSRFIESALRTSRSELAEVLTDHVDLVAVRERS